MTAHADKRAEKKQRAKKFEQSRWRQLAILTRRYFELMLADRKNLALLLLQAPIIGLLLVLVSHVDGMTTGRIEAKKVIFMLATTGVWFGVINAAREICKEASVLRRERLARTARERVPGVEVRGAVDARARAERAAARRA